MHKYFPEKKHILSLAVLTITQFLMVAGATLTMVAMPTIRQMFAVSDAHLHWVITAYGMPFGCLLLVGGSIADRLGQRRILLLGLSCFTLASLLCAVSATFGQLVIFRALQGLSAAFVTPAALGLLGRIFTGHSGRMRALGAWSMVGAIGAVTGNILGGLLTEFIGWRAVFIFVVPLGPALIFLAHRILPSGAVDCESRIDVLGAILAASAIFCLFIAVTQSSAPSGSILPVLVLIAFCIILGFLFIWLQLHLSYALVPLRALCNRASFAFLVVLMTGLTYGPFLALTVHFQETLRLSPLQSGLAITPWAIAITIFSRLAARFGTHISSRSIIVSGFLAISGGTAWVIAAMDTNVGLLYGLIPAQIVLGIGNALAFFGTSVMAMSALPADRQGVAAGLLSSSQQIGNAVTMATFSTLSFVYAAPISGRLGWQFLDGVSRGPKHALAFLGVAAVGTAAFSLLVLPGVSNLRSERLEP